MCTHLAGRPQWRRSSPDSRPAPSRTAAEGSWLPRSYLPATFELSGSEGEPQESGSPPIWHCRGTSFPPVTSNGQDEGHGRVFLAKGASMRKVLAGLAMAAVVLGACAGSETGRPFAEQTVNARQTENIYDGGNVVPSEPVSDRTTSPRPWDATPSNEKLRSPAHDAYCAALQLPAGITSTRCLPPAPPDSATACAIGDTGIKACGNADGTISYSYPPTTPTPCPADLHASARCFLRDGQLVVATSSS